MITLTVFRLFLAYTQFVTITPPLAPLDDDFMFQSAVSIINGDWFGEYNFLTLSKHNFFSIWLAFLHILKIPYLVGNTFLYAIACFITILSIQNVLKHNHLKALLFAALLYNPAMWANYSTRIYRDAIFPSLCLIFFAGVIGIGLRYKQPLKEKLLYLLLIGFSYGAIYLTREDGIWILPFYIVALIIITFISFKGKQKNIIKNLIIYLSPMIISLAIIGLYSYQNYIHYDRFIVSDFTSSEFEKAYGSLASIEQEEWHPLIAVPNDVRYKLYEEVPSFKELETTLESDTLKNGYYNTAIDGFGSGAFYWAVRVAVEEAGYYENTATSKEYYERLYSEVVLAIDENRLSANNLHTGLTPPIKADYILPVIKEAFNGMKAVILFEQTSPIASAAVGYPEEIKEVEDFIHQKGGTILAANTTTPYLDPIRNITHTFMEVMNYFYKFVVIFMLISTIVWQIYKLRYDLKHKVFNSNSMLNIILLGIILMAILRSFMIAYVEVSSFNIGTYIMYLSTIHPLIILYSVLGFCKVVEVGIEKSTKKQLDDIIVKYEITTVGNGYIECICPSKNIENFLDEVGKLNIKVDGFHWWCFSPSDDSHKPCGMGGPKVKNGFYSEINMQNFYEFETINLMKQYLLYDYKETADYKPCFNPAFWLNVPKSWKPLSDIK